MSEWIERLARLGYASIGTVYLIVGVLAVFGKGKGGGTGDRDAALSMILQQPFGRTMLAVIAIGLSGYVVWRLASAVSDTEHRGDDAKGLAIRAGSFLRGLIYAVITVEVVRLILRKGSGGSGGESASHWTGRLMQMPFGRFVVAAAGLAVIAYGAYQLRGKLSKRLRRVPPRMASISRFGIAARGVVFIVIGGSIVAAAVRHDASEARGTSGALRQLSEPADGWLLVLIGAGLASYGVYAWINARYRKIDA